MSPHVPVIPVQKVLKTCALALLAMVGITSCDMAFGFNKNEYVRLNTDLETAWRQTASYSYILDTNNRWKSPKEFEHDGGGDCEDFAVHLMYDLGVSSVLYVVRLRGKETYHAIVLYDGKFLEPQIYNQVYDPADFEVAYYRDYFTIMLYATGAGSKRISPDGFSILIR